VKEALVKFQQQSDTKASLNVGSGYTPAGVRLRVLNILGNFEYPLARSYPLLSSSIMRPPPRRGFSMTSWQFRPIRLTSRRGHWPTWSIASPSYTPRLQLGMLSPNFGCKNWLMKIQDFPQWYSSYAILSVGYRRNRESDYGEFYSATCVQVRLNDPARL
jgi:hypothetical protein